MKRSQWRARVHPNSLDDRAHAHSTGLPVRECKRPCLHPLQKWPWGIDLQGETPFQSTTSDSAQVWMPMLPEPFSIHS